jgi:predicted RNA-binding protein with PUA-like domain
MAERKPARRPSKVSKARSGGKKSASKPVKPKAAIKSKVAPKAGWKLPPVAPRQAGEKRYWLLKTEPHVFSYSDLERAPKATTSWDGVRNYQARNYLRDQIKTGDGVLIYHSGSDGPAIAGIATITRDGFADPTQFDPKDGHFDPDATVDSPTWFAVGVTAVRPLARPLTLDVLRATKSLARMVLLQKGSRLSVQPVSPGEWEAILALAAA